MAEIGRVNAHKTTHQDGGADELDLTGLTRSPVFVDRGDPAAWDYQLGDLTTDGNWNNLNLSSIIPSGALAVLLQCTASDDATNSLIQFRKDGNSNTINCGGMRTQVANVENKVDVIVALPSTRIVEYNASNLTWSGIYICVRGWFI